MESVVITQEGDTASQRPILTADILDALSATAAVLHGNGRVHIAGRRFCQWWQRDPEALEGVSIGELMPDEAARQQVNQALSELCGSGVAPGATADAGSIERTGQRRTRITLRRLEAPDNVRSMILMTLTEAGAERRPAAAPSSDDNRFRLLAEAAFEGIAFTRNGRFVDLNDQLADMLGYPREALIGEPVVDCVAPEHRKRVAAFLKADHRGPYEHLALRRDGTPIPVEIRVRASFIDGRKTRITAVRDLSGSKRAASELRTSEKKLRQMVDHAGAILWTVDTDLRFTSTLGRGLARLDLRPDQIVGLSLFDFFETDDPDFIAISAHRQALAGNSVTYEQAWAGAIFQIRLEPLYGDPNDIVGVSGVAIDITERKKAMKALELTQFTIDRASFGCAWIRRDGRFYYVNDQTCCELGYPRSELLAMSIIDIDPQFNPDIWSDYWLSLLRDKVRTFETDYRRRDGTTFPVEITANYVEFAGEAFSCAFSVDISARRAAQDALQRFRFSTERASEAIFWIGEDARFMYANEQGCRSLGYTREELMQLQLWDIDPCLPPARWRIQWAELRETGYRVFETIHRRKDGSEFPVEISANHIRAGDTDHHVAFVRDISDRKRVEAEQAKLEAQLFQAQKMESIGRLAGGVAHDFNNMLGVILGYAELMKTNLAPDNPLLQQVLEIEKAANHSRDITAQLLAFSRKQVVSPRVLDLNTRIDDMQKTLARLIGEDIDLTFVPADSLWQVFFDPTQIEQILINLAINARDAMPDGGRLTIATANVHPDDAYFRKQAGLLPGEFVRLSVDDNGTGMAPETVAHIFEPFFTTKSVGKGTGLGLATVYGIVRQGGGFIDVESELGRGTTFHIYLLRHTTADDRVDEPAEDAVAAGAETVLLVEDDGMVRIMTQAMLEHLGYTVHARSTPEAALAFIEAGEEAVDLLMTDVVMPGMNGKVLHDRIARMQPTIRTLFMSGYTADVIAQHGVLDEGVHFLQKPFNMDTLARKIREALKPA